MQPPLICHFLIGIPGCGKSSFATMLTKLTEGRIVSTDGIRKSLYGDERIQGNWEAIEQEAIAQIQAAIAAGNSVIYDATNAKRGWRMSLLCKLRQFEVPWMGWQLVTPLATCKRWNQMRSRQVPEGVLESMSRSLHQFPPLMAEGFSALYRVNPEQGFHAEDIQGKIQRLRDRHPAEPRYSSSQPRYHRYSQLQDFDRLMHLISLILRYPGIGNLQNTAPSVLETLFDPLPQFTSAIEEISAVMGKLAGELYADSVALASDLAWLEKNHLIGSGGFWDGNAPPIQVEQVENLAVSPHFYSAIAPFKRVLATIRFIIHHPIFREPGPANFQALAIALQEQEIIPQTGDNHLRKDIDRILKPYKILADLPLKPGYFAGTAIFSPRELKQIYWLLQSQECYLADPLALSISQQLKDRMGLTELNGHRSDAYSIREIAHYNARDFPFIPRIEAAIAQATLLEFKRIPGFKDLSKNTEHFFLAWPLKIIFYRGSWYLGYECEGGTEPGLFRLERLDRLRVNQEMETSRSAEIQEKSGRQLETLYQESAGIFLGTSTTQQRRFLSSNPENRKQVELIVELWFTDKSFRFIREETKHLPSHKITISEPFFLQEDDKLSPIYLTPSPDPEFPNRLQIKVPKWSLNDVTFLRWIVGFDGNLKIHTPPELVKKIKKIGQEIVRVYHRKL
ncbi:WYL domain-containing protein [Laspinema olomoucense]|uniref:WYL domain-containing protein n=1 Tax=Laspinema olomoucense TaxID=3231600 RepID=UPI0021BBB351|nr:WYL domain-containing protein [Laspinema sp. D3a]